MDRGGTVSSTSARRARLLALPWALLLVWQLAVPALSQSAPTSITLTPDSDNVGSVITIDGTGWDRTAHETPGPNGSKVEFSFVHPNDPSRTIQNLVVDDLQWLDRETFTATFLVPDLPADPTVNGYRVTAEQYSGELSATANFVILPSLDIDISRRAVGDPFALTGTGWDMDEPFAFEIRRSDGSALPEPYAGRKVLTPATFGPLGPDTVSMFRATFATPALPAGNYLVEASQFRRKLIQQVPLEVLPTLTLAPAAGPTGSAVTATATGFDQPEALSPAAPAKTEDVTLLFDGEVVARFGTGAGPRWTSDTAWEAPFSVPTRQPGRYRVIACQGSPRDAATCTGKRIVAAATFTVAPVSLFSDPSEGLGGTTTSVSGAGWNRDEDLTISFDDEVVASIPAGTVLTATGAFEIEIDIPDVVADGYPIRACQLCGEPNEVSAQVVFTVLPSLEVTPALNQPFAETIAEGQGWNHEIQLNLFVGSVEVAVLAPGASGFRGATRFNQAFATPSIPEGEYEVRACQRCGAAREISATTTLRIIPIIEPQPPIGPPGFVPFIQGDGFPANAAVVLEWDRGLGTVEVTANADGRFRVPFLVMRNDGHGPRLVRARIVANEAAPPDDVVLEPTALFTVVPGSAQPNDWQYRR